MVNILAVVTTIVSHILLALVVFLVGRFIIKKFVKWLDKSKMMEKLDPSLHTFLVSFIRIALFALLLVAIITILGVPRPPSSPCWPPPVWPSAWRFRAPCPTWRAASCS